MLYETYYSLVCDLVYSQFLTMFHLFEKKINALLGRKWLYILEVCIFYYVV